MAHKQFAVLMSILLLSTNCLCEEAQNDAAKLIPFETFYNRLDRDPIADYHQYALLVDKYMKQMSRLQSAKSQTKDEKTLLAQMQSEDHLQWLKSMAKVHVEFIVENPTKNRETQQEDLKILMDSVKAIEKLLPADAVIRVPRSDAKSLKKVSAEEEKQLAITVERIVKHFSEDKFEEIVKDDLQSVDPAKLAKHLSKMIPMMKQLAKIGIPALMTELVKDRSKWFIDKDGYAVLVCTGEHKGVATFVLEDRAWRWLASSLGENAIAEYGFSGNSEKK